MDYKTWDNVTEDLTSQGKQFFHQITYYIGCPLTLEQWSDLDDKMSDVLSEVIGSDEHTGFAGPIPFDDWYEEAVKVYDEMVKDENSIDI